MKKILLGFLLFTVVTVFSSSAVRADNSDAVLSKLSQIERQQAEILKKLDEVMTELQIVKVRASLRS